MVVYILPPNAKTLLGLFCNSNTFVHLCSHITLSSSGNVNIVQWLVLLQPLRWRCVDCVIHHERDVREEQKYMYVARTSNNRVISSGDLYCCLLPRCEALRKCRAGFPIATVSMPVVRLFVGSALIISFGLAFRLEVTPLIGVLLMHLFKKFRVYV